MTISFGDPGLNTSSVSLSCRKRSQNRDSSLAKSPVSKQVWHDKHPFLRKCEAHRPRFCSPSRNGDVSIWWKTLELDVKQQTHKQTIVYMPDNLPLSSGKVRVLSLWLVLTSVVSRSTSTVSCTVLVWFYIDTIWQLYNEIDNMIYMIV